MRSLMPPLELLIFLLPLQVVPFPFSPGFSHGSLHGSPRASLKPSFAEIRPATEKSETLAYGWDGTTAKGGAVDDSKSSRLLSDIRGESLPSKAEVFLANAEMAPSEIAFQSVIDTIDECYEDNDVEFTNNGVSNGPGENHGSAKLLSLAALAGLDEAATLALWGEHFRGVAETPEGEDHQNIRAFMRGGWEGVDFPGGVALTKKVSGSWGWDEESFIP